MLSFKDNGNNTKMKKNQSKPRNGHIPFKPAWNKKQNPLLILSDFYSFLSHSYSLSLFGMPKTTIIG
jgi:hypothetical protein